MQIIVAVELRLISGCIIGTCMHNLSLGIQRTLFYIMYIKSRYSFALFSLTSLALAVGKKKNLRQVSRSQESNGKQE